MLGKKRRLVELLQDESYWSSKTDNNLLDLQFKT
jgi:hypothetical protein